MESVSPSSFDIVRHYDATGRSKSTEQIAAIFVYQDNTKSGVSAREPFPQKTTRRAETPPYWTIYRKYTSSGVLFRDTRGSFRKSTTGIMARNRLTTSS